MVDNLKVTTELGILMLEGIKAMGTTGQYLSSVVGLKKLDVLLASGYAISLYYFSRKAPSTCCIAILGLTKN